MFQNERQGIQRAQFPYSVSAGSRIYRALLNSEGRFKSCKATARLKRIAIQSQFMIASADQGAIVERVNDAAV